MKKQPKQERSRQIVDSVLTSATRILSKMNLRDVTTNKIAEAAGVGIGSLYDYFPNKKSIVESLIDQRISSAVKDFSDLLEKDPQLPIEQTIEEVLEYLRTDFLERKEFLREIFTLAPESGRMESLYHARVNVTATLAQHLLKKHPDLDEDHAQQRAFLAVHGTMGLIESYIMVVPSYFPKENFVSELREFLRSLLLNKNRLQSEAK